MTVDVRHYTAEDLDQIRETILDIHVEVRHRDFGLTGPFYDRDRFDERLAAYASRPGWTAVLGYDGEQPAGFCFGTTLASDTKWWDSMLEPQPVELTREDGHRTVALNEIVVRKEWRGRSIAWQLHEAWLGPALKSVSPSWSTPRPEAAPSKPATRPGATNPLALSSPSPTHPASPPCSAPSRWTERHPTPSVSSLSEPLPTLL
ncbi:hypothetical protein ACFQ60_07590 [Streptomyces zhihengii]